MARQLSKLTGIYVCTYVAQLKVLAVSGIWEGSDEECYHTFSDVHTFMGGNFAYGAIPVANSNAVIPKLQMSAFSL